MNEEHVCRELPALGRGIQQPLAIRNDNIETNSSTKPSSSSISVNISGEATHNVGRIEVLIHPGGAQITKPELNLKPTSTENRERANYVQALQEIQLLTSTTLDSNLVQTQTLFQKKKKKKLLY